jgi:hypothetical protein
MIFILITLVIFLLNFFTSVYLPWWWTVAIIPFLVVSVFKPIRSTYAFLSGFIAIFLLWSSTAFVIDYKNDHMLANSLAKLFNLPHSFLLIIITGLVGGLVGGFSSLSGSYFRKLFK